MKKVQPALIVLVLAFLALNAGAAGLANVPASPHIDQGVEKAPATADRTRVLITLHDPVSLAASAAERARAVARAQDARR